MLASNRILVPVDFTEQCRATARFAVELASRYRAEVFLLHVFEVPPGSIGVESPVAIDSSADSRKKRLSEICRKRIDFNIGSSVATLPQTDAWVRRTSPFSYWIGDREGAARCGMSSVDRPSSRTFRR